MTTQHIGYLIVTALGIALLAVFVALAVTSKRKPPTPEDLDAVDRDQQNW